MVRPGASTRNITYARQIEERLRNMADDPVFRRLNNIIAFRSEHHKLEQVISTTFGASSSVGGPQENSAGGQEFRNQALADIRDAFTTFVKSIEDVLDTSAEGQEQWDAAKKAYEVATAKIELQLTQMLK